MLDNNIEVKKILAVGILISMLIPYMVVIAIGLTTAVVMLGIFMTS